MHEKRAGDRWRNKLHLIHLSIDGQAVAGLSLGPDRWPRFMGGAARKAVAAVDAGSVPGVIRASAVDTGLEVVVVGTIVTGMLMYLSQQNSATRPSPVIPSIVENRLPPQDAKDPNGAKAPGKPGEAEGYEEPKGGEQWIPNPNGRGYG